MAKENQARLLGILCQGCGNNEIRGTGYIRCETKTEDLCVAAVKHLDGNNVFAVMPLDFPLWIDIKDRLCANTVTSDNGLWHFVGSYSTPQIFYVEYYGEKTLSYYFKFTEQGYKEACEWIESKRTNAIKKLCEGINE